MVHKPVNSVCYRHLLAALLNSDQPVSGVTIGTLEAPFQVIAPMARIDGTSVQPNELAVTAGWGHGGSGRPVMPGRGRIVERDTYTEDEIAVFGAAASARSEPIDVLLERLGPPIDVWLNDVAYWRSVPKSVWEFRIGGYQVFKKWLSYREHYPSGSRFEARILVKKRRCERFLGHLCSAHPQKIV